MTEIRPRGPTARAYVQDKRNQRLGWAKAIGELIDNSIGNGASHVEVAFRPHCVKCIDDGVGCDAKKFAALVSPGMHVEDDVIRNTVSRYGVGAKDAFIWCGGPTRVFSVRSGECRFIEVDWDAFGSEWEFDDVIEGESARTLCESVGLSRAGVCIEIPHHNRQLNEKQFLDVHEQLSRMFWAAVETGVEISVTFSIGMKRKRLAGGLLPGKPMPALIPDKTADGHVTLADGRQVRIVGGVLAPGARISNPGFEYIYGHRVVVQAGSLGAGTMDFERVYFRVFLLGDKEDWQVTTNKAGLHDADEAALGEVVFEQCRGLLEYSQSESMAELADQDLLREASELLTAGNRKRAKRQRTDDSKEGTVEPKNTGRKQTRTNKWHDEDGSYETPLGGRRSDHIDIKRGDFEAVDEHLVGKAFVRDRIVRVNALHPFIKRCLESRDKVSLFVAAMAIWSDAFVRVDSSGQGRLPFNGTFADKISAMLKVNASDNNA